MSRFRRILVPIDGSAASLEAHRLALDLAGRYGAEIIMLYVVDSSVLAEYSRLTGQERPCLLRDMEDSGTKLLASLRKEAQEVGVKATASLQTGAPDEIITQEAGRHRVDLIVMGKIGHKRHRHSLVGSVTERVLEAAELPVLVVGLARGASVGTTGHD